MAVGGQTPSHAKQKIQSGDFMSVTHIEVKDIEWIIRAFMDAGGKLTPESQHLIDTELVEVNTIAMVDDNILLFTTLKKFPESMNRIYAWDVLGIFYGPKKLYYDIMYNGHWDPIQGKPRENSGR